MSQNRSSAVMQRRVEPHDSFEDFPTPPWATRALCRWLFDNQPTNHLTFRDPCANRGYMVRPLQEYTPHVDAMDIFDYGMGFPVQDYLFPGTIPEVDWTFMNPPFRLAEQFIARALDTSRKGIAVLVRSAFLEGVGRYNSLYRFTPPHHILQFTERVVMHKGRVTKDGSTATSYCWLVWELDRDPGQTNMHWTGICRKQLEREGDYDVYGHELEPGISDL